jgi:hypothetical protein
MPGLNFVTQRVTVAFKEEPVKDGSGYRVGREETEVRIAHELLDGLTCRSQSQALRFAQECVFSGESEISPLPGVGKVIKISRYWKTDGGNSREVHAIIPLKLVESICWHSKYTRHH